MEIALNIFLVAIGFGLLIKGADFLVSGASSLAKRFNASDIAIGLTVVAMGTSAPELVVNIISGVDGKTGMVFGNIIGSNIFNLYLILGISSVIYPIAVKKSTVWKEIPYSLLATIVLFFLLNDSLLFGHDRTNQLSRIDGWIMLVMFGLFLTYVFKNLTSKDSEEELEEVEVFTSLKTTLMIVGGIVGLSVGGRVIVSNAVDIARHFSVSEQIIGLTILAAGTSLPELATSAVAALQKKPDLAVGNIIGSNVFNILLVLPITTIISGNLPYDISLNTDIYIVIIGTIALMVFMYTLSKNKVDRTEGIVYLLGFLGYCVYLFTRTL